MIFFNENDNFDQDSLYSKLVDLVEPILQAEKFQRDQLTAKFEEETKTEREAFELAIKPAYDKAHDALTPLKEALDAKIASHRKHLEKMIDKEVKAFAKKQTVLQIEYDKATKAERLAYDESVKPVREKFEAEIEKLGQEAQAQIEPINQEYRRLAEKLDTVTIH